MASNRAGIEPTPGPSAAPTQVGGRRGRSCRGVAFSIRNELSGQETESHSRQSRLLPPTGVGAGWGVRRDGRECESAHSSLQRNDAPMELSEEVMQRAMRRELEQDAQALNAAGGSRDGEQEVAAARCMVAKEQP